MTKLKTAGRADRIRMPDNADVAAVPPSTGPTISVDPRPINV